MDDEVLAGGWQKGDRIASLIDHKNVKKGDMGTILGPCIKDQAGKADRVHVDFGSGKGDWNFLKTQIVGVPLAGGWQKGDPVTSLIDHKNVKKGDVGTILGPCIKDQADTADRVHVDFGSGKGDWDFLKTQIEAAPLAGGWRKGDYVASLIVHKNVKKGDLGTILGPCIKDQAHKADRVHVDFGSGKGLWNFLKTQIEAAPLASCCVSGGRNVKTPDTFENHAIKRLQEEAAQPEFEHEVVASVQHFLGKLPDEESAANRADCQVFFRDLHKDCKLQYARELHNGGYGHDALEAVSPECTAQVMWTSALTLSVGGVARELCWLVNWCIRTGNVVLLTLLMPFIKALNLFAAPLRKGVTNSVPLWDMLTDYKLFRGGGFDLDFKGFFVKGKQFRVPGFWATTPTKRVADFFMTRAFQANYQPVLWIINIDKDALCWHVNSVARSLIMDSEGKPHEDEFLFTQFSAFEVIEVKWRTGAATPSAPHEIHVNAFPDNRQAPVGLISAPWS